MRNIIEDEVYEVTSRCNQCGEIYHERLKGKFINDAKRYCVNCKIKTEDIDVKQVRQILME
jgi:hypothetical protein